jgi:hypothetical protein
MPARIAGIQATWMFPGHSIPGTWVPAIHAGTTAVNSGSYSLPNPKRHGAPLAQHLFDPVEALGAVHAA